MRLHYNTYNNTKSLIIKAGEVSKLGYLLKYVMIN